MDSVLQNVSTSCKGWKCAAVVLVLTAVVWAITRTSATTASEKPKASEYYSDLSTEAQRLWYDSAMSLCKDRAVLECPVSLREHRTSCMLDALTKCQLFNADVISKECELGLSKTRCQMCGTDSNDVRCKTCRLTQLMNGVCSMPNLS